MEELILQVKITEREDAEITDNQVKEIVESMKLWLREHLPHSKLVRK